MGTLLFMTVDRIHPTDRKVMLRSIRAFPGKLTGVGGGG